MKWHDMKGRKAAPHECKWHNTDKFIYIYTRYWENLFAASLHHLAYVMCCDEQKLSTEDMHFTHIIVQQIGRSSSI